MAASLPSGVLLMAARTSSAISGTTPITAFPSLPMVRGSIPRRSQALATPSLMGMDGKSISMPMWDLEHHSLRVFASPPRVGSFMATMPPTASPSAIILLRGATSLFSSVSNP